MKFGYSPYRVKINWGPHPRRFQNRHRMTKVKRLIANKSRRINRAKK